MARFRFFVLLAVLYSCSELGQCEVTSPKTVLIDVPPQHQDAAPVQPSDPIVSSTKAPITTSTEKTTDAPTTTPSTTTSTTTPAPPTPAPTPAPPTPAPTPAPKPGPVPSPDQGTWAYTNENNVTCIVVQFAAQLNVTYPKGVNNTLVHVLMNVPKDANISGNCNTTEQWIELSWDPVIIGNDTYKNVMKIVFAQNATTKSYEFHGLNLSVSRAVFVNSTFENNVDLWHGKEWETPLTSYRCSRPTELKLTPLLETSNVAAVLTFSKLQEEAFRNTTGSSFSAARECGGGDVPDAVPIAVGCALGALVVVVLVAYLVARRRSAARGYLSM
ncbi:LOW QUALITY PROTEIN: lysosome-associated membrane glycoprotein 1 [Aphomia sociella]